MKYHTQRFKHDPDNGIFGDCQRTALACLLDLELDEVPHFGEGFPDSIEFHNRVRDFLKTRGLTTFSVPFNATLDDVLIQMGNLNPNVDYLLSGMSKRGFNHVVLARGGSIIHDPHEDRSNLIGPCDDGYYWVEVLTPNPKY